MLARHADLVYWFGRNVERAENCARLLNVQTSLLLDLPRRTQFNWAELPAILGNEDTFHELYDEANEQTVLTFMVLDKRNPGSILTSLDMARENLRALRDNFPREIWEYLNNLYMTVRDDGDAVLDRSTRNAFLQDVIRGTLLIAGQIFSSMSTDLEFSFMRIGVNLERADMTSRIIDATASRLLPQRDSDLALYQNIQWMSVLKSLTAYQMYRRHVRRRVNGPDVVNFLLLDKQFPRSLQFCVDRISAALAGLPRAGGCNDALAAVNKELRALDVRQLSDNQTSDYLDRIQQRLNDLHECIESRYLRVDPNAVNLVAGRRVEQ